MRLSLGYSGINCKKNFLEQRASKIKKWLDQKPCSLKINTTAQPVPYISNDATLGWIAT